MKKQADGRQLELSLLIEGSREDHRHLITEVPGTTLLFFVGVFFLFFLPILISIIILVS